MRRLVQHQPVWACDLLILHQATLTFRVKGGKRGSEIQSEQNDSEQCFQDMFQIQRNLKKKNDKKKKSQKKWTKHHTIQNLHMGQVILGFPLGPLRREHPGKCINREKSFVSFSEATLNYSSPNVQPFKMPPGQWSLTVPSSILQGSSSVGI